jgi:chorismate synthase
MQKYGFDDARDVLERASARETAARVAAGTCAKALLAHLGVDVLSHVVAVGSVEARAGARPQPGDLGSVDASQLRCFDPEVEEAMVAEVKAAAKVGDSLGGEAEMLAQALMSIQAVKSVGIGDGADLAGRRGSQAHDAIVWDADAGVYRRETSRAGGIEGGMSTGDLLVARVAMKPLATLNRPVLKTVDVVSKEETVSFKERTDVTAVPAMGVVAETMVALTLAKEALRKFGGDSLSEVVRNRDAYVATLQESVSEVGARDG